jgi:two-component system nitrogen regulation response regulator GlnG
MTVSAGRFVHSLNNRLKNGHNIALPPLRERREDIGLLLVAFLRVRFGSAAELQRIQSSAEYPGGWLPASALASIARSRLPGNVRDIEGMATNLFTCVGPGARDPRAVVAERLAAIEQLTPAAHEERPSGGRKARDVAAALEASGWNRQRAMKLLGVSKQTLWRELRTRPELAKLLDFSLEELRRQVAACGGDLARLAAELGVPEQLLARRLAPGH